MVWLKVFLSRLECAQKDRPEVSYHNIKTKTVSIQWMQKHTLRLACRLCHVMLLQKDDDLADLIKQRGKQPESDTSLWACLSRFVDYKNGRPIPQQTLAANAGMFFGAGYETTAHAITWALFELAADPSIQVWMSKLASSARPSAPRFSATALARLSAYLSRPPCFPASLTSSLPRTELSCILSGSHSLIRCVVFFCH